MHRHLCLALLLAAALASHARAQEDAKIEQMEKSLLELTNEQRAKKELPPLKLSPLLGKVARAHSENMAKQEKMEHDLDGNTPFDRMSAAGYRYMKAAENIGYADARLGVTFVMKAWMESEGHRQNILEADFTEIGLGVGRDKAGRLYFTQVFGTPLR